MNSLRGLLNKELQGECIAGITVDDVQQEIEIHTESGKVLMLRAVSDDMAHFEGTLAVTAVTVF